MNSKTSQGIQIRGRGGSVTKSKTSNAHISKLEKIHEKLNKTSKKKLGIKIRRRGGALTPNKRLSHAEK